MVLEHTGGQFLYKNDSLNSAFTVWDLAKNKTAAQGSGTLRDLESVLVKADGSLIRADLAASVDAADTGMPAGGPSGIICRAASCQGWNDVLYASGGT